MLERPELWCSRMEAFSLAEFPILHDGTEITTLSWRRDDDWLAHVRLL